MVSQGPSLLKMLEQGITFVSSMHLFIYLFFQFQRVPLLSSVVQMGHAFQDQHDATRT